LAVLNPAVFVTTASIVGPTEATADLVAAIFTQ